MTEKKATKKYRTVTFDVVERMQQQLGLNDREFSEALGYGHGAINGWRSSGRAPEVARIAAECLVRRIGPDAAKLNPVGPSIVVLRLQTEEDEAFVSLMLERIKGASIVYSTSNHKRPLR